MSSQTRFSCALTVTLLAVLAVTLLASFPARVLAAGCSCCERDVCPLKAGGCAHQQAVNAQRSSGCCIGTAQNTSLPTITRQVEMRPAILATPSRPQFSLDLDELTVASAPALAAPTLAPEPPPPRS